MTHRHPSDTHQGEPHPDLSINQLSDGPWWLRSDKFSGRLFVRVKYDGAQELFYRRSDATTACFDADLFWKENDLIDVTPILTIIGEDSKPPLPEGVVWNPVGTIKFGPKQSLDGLPSSYTFYKLDDAMGQPWAYRAVKNSAPDIVYQIRFAAPGRVAQVLSSAVTTAPPDVAKSADWRPETWTAAQ